MAGVAVQISQAAMVGKGAVEEEADGFLDLQAGHESDYRGQDRGWSGGRGRALEEPGGEGRGIVRENGGHLAILTEDGPVDNWFSGPAGRSQQVPAGLQGVQGIQSQINPGEMGGIAGGMEIFQEGLNFQGRVDTTDKFGGGPGFGFAQGFGGGQKLPVQVGGSKEVAVGQQQAAQAQPGQELSLIASQATQTHH
jgi:hypothetical protein